MSDDRPPYVLSKPLHGLLTSLRRIATALGTPDTVPRGVFEAVCGHYFFRPPHRVLIDLVRGQYLESKDTHIVLKDRPLPAPNKLLGELIKGSLSIQAERLITSQALAGLKPELPAPRTPVDLPSENELPVPKKDIMRRLPAAVPSPAAPDEVKPHHLRILANHARAETLNNAPLPSRTSLDLFKYEPQCRWREAGQRTSLKRRGLLQQDAAGNWMVTEAGHKALATTNQEPTLADHELKQLRR